MKSIRKAIVPLGFKASAVACGLKKSGKLDLALLYSELPAKAAGVFTTNTIPAAPVILCRRHLARFHSFRAILANSGNANCFTGKAGMIDAQAMARLAAGTLGLKEHQVFVASTGVIGKKLDLGKIQSALPGLASQLKPGGIVSASRAIMTTDLFPKEITVRFKIGSQTVSICAIAKGAGMIAPHMATMLAFFLTDANISQGALTKALGAAVKKSFNCVTVDGCMSTNDTALVLANGAAKNKQIKGGRGLFEFSRALEYAALELAKLMVRDGEGASKFITITVKGGRTHEEARKVALDIANSNLFKTAMYGENPNFGRIVASVGASRVGVREQDIAIKVSSLKKRDIFVSVDIKKGKASAVVYTSDLTPEYIKINAAYN